MLFPSRTAALQITFLTTELKISVQVSLGGGSSIGVNDYNVHSVDFVQ
jgi:hypothetical protein